MRVRQASGRGDFAPRDAALRVLAVAARRFAAPALAAGQWHPGRGSERLPQASMRRRFHSTSWDLREHGVAVWAFPKPAGEIPSVNHASNPPYPGPHAVRVPGPIDNESFSRILASSTKPQKRLS